MTPEAAAVSLPEAADRPHERLVVRRLLVDLDSPIPRRWAGGDAFVTAFFDALSMSFPVGEQFFIDAVRAGVAALPPQLPVTERTRWQDEVRGFVGQEATHRRIHERFNAHLEAQGRRNAWGPRAQARLARLAGTDPRHALAITAANEHFTALLARHLLAYPRWLDGAEPRLRTLWLWHAAEEQEHRCTAFDLYRALGGDERWRRHWMRVVTVYLLLDAWRQTLANLRADGALASWRTWRSAARFFLGRDGLLRHTFGAWRAWFRADFHPSGEDDGLAQRWLRDNAEAYREVALAPPEGSSSGIGVSAPAIT